MNTLRIIICAVAVLAFSGCGPSEKTTSDQFHLTFQEIATDANACAAQLTIQTGAEAMISVDQEGGGHNSARLPDPAAGKLREGSVALMASRITPPGEGDIFVQTLIRVQTSKNNYAGGPATYTLPRATELADFFTITAKSGNYPLNTPLEIARLKGQAVTLTVGKPTHQSAESENKSP